MPADQVPDEFDASWYLSTYPQAQADIAAKFASSADDHFKRLGEARGYLTHADATRAPNPAKYRSRFGGLWTDAANALDLLRGKHTLGLVNDSQAELIQKWIQDGYVILKGAVPPEMVDAARKDMEIAYSDAHTDTTFECVAKLPRLSKFLPHHRDVPAKALDTHWFFESTRDAIFAPNIVDFIQCVFERRPMATQSLGFWRGSQQDCHQDSAFVAYTLNMQFCASWIALEDVTAGAGELFFYPGSQNLTEVYYPDGVKNIVESARRVPSINVEKRIDEHVRALPYRSELHGLKKHSFIAEAGDVLIWSADLAHGGMPISNAETRKSLVTHYSPSEVAPLYFEEGFRSIRLHRDIYPYSTSVYDS